MKEKERLTFHPDLVPPSGILAPAHEAHSALARAAISSTRQVRHFAKLEGFGPMTFCATSEDDLGHYRVCSRSHKDWWLPLFRAPHGGRMTSSRGQNLSEVRV